MKTLKYNSFSPVQTGRQDRILLNIKIFRYMRQISLTMIMLLFCGTITFAQIKLQRVKPVYVAAKLLEIVDPDSYPEVMAYYGYERDSTAAPGENRYSYNGSTAIWLDNLTEDADSIHELTFLTPQSLTEIESALLDNGYIKTTKPMVDKPSISGTRFERRLRFSNRARVIIIQSGSPNVLHLLHKK